MRLLPPPRFRLKEWPLGELSQWEDVTRRAETRRGDVGRNSAFDRMVRTIRERVRAGSVAGLDALLRTRAAARALSWLWLEDRDVRRSLLKAEMLDLLCERQKPRLTRLTLANLVSLYFKYFDELDSGQGTGLRRRLESVILEQVKSLPPPADASHPPDLFRTLRQDGIWLLDIDGPSSLVKRTRERSGELAVVLEEMGLAGMDVGRFGDVCRAHYYLATLQELRPGQWNPVLDELLKPAVAKAPYRGELRIGHAALAILIDRSGSDPGERWQEFILAIAGDPRISTRSSRYQAWWRPLGEARVAKVRSWLSKLDLRLFLEAVEEYGYQSRNASLRRMFPARKRFLEGLHQLGLVRASRLMLGSGALDAVRRILGKELTSSFARLTSGMSDKAVIYLDCGEFCLIEGSHSFKIWTFLEPPSPKLMNYEKTEFTHADLTVEVPKDYGDAYPDYYYVSIVHNGPWQWRLFDFLADNGIELDIEQLLTPEDYRQIRDEYGTPVATPEARRDKQQRLARRARTQGSRRAPDILAGEAET